MTIPAPSTKKRSNTALWIIAGILGFLMLAVVSLAGSIVWYGFQAFSEQARTAIREDKDVLAAVGEIREIHFDLGATGDAPGDEEFAFRIEGSRTSGLLVGRFVTIDEATEDLREGHLILDDGRVVRLGDSRRDGHGETDREPLEINL